MSLIHTLDHLVQRYCALQEPVGWPTLPWEKEWPSPCLLFDSDEGIETPWRPVKMEEQVDMFERLSEALSTPIHADLKSYFTRYWSDPIYARHPEGELSLLFVWNSEEFERLRANLIGHALNKQRMRQPLTLFFACTEPDAQEFISVLNQDGSIWLEAPGKAPLRKLADSLDQFLQQLEPLTHPDTR